MPRRLRSWPFARASESPIAIACFLLFTVLPLLPDLRVPFFRRRIALSTRLDAALPYLLRPEDFLAAILLTSRNGGSGRSPDHLAHVVPYEKLRGHFHPFVLLELWKMKAAHRRTRLT